jgi:hypothetical protein
VSDHYIALIDPTASPSEAPALAARIVTCLSSRALIQPVALTASVLGGQGFPPGPGCERVYDRASGESAFWTLQTSGVQVHSTPWINEFGFKDFETAVCPECKRVYGQEFVDRMLHGFDTFIVDPRVPRVECPACGTSSSLHSWACVPHLGFVSLSVVFWNWPPFDAPGWRLDVRRLLSQSLGRPFTMTYGRV